MICVEHRRGLHVRRRERKGDYRSTVAWQPEQSSAAVLVTWSSSFFFSLQGAPTNGSVDVKVPACAPSAHVFTGDDVTKKSTRRVALVGGELHAAVALTAMIVATAQAMSQGWVSAGSPRCLAEHPLVLCPN